MLVHVHGVIGNLVILASSVVLTSSFQNPVYKAQFISSNSLQGLKLSSENGGQFCY